MTKHPGCLTRRSLLTAAATVTVALPVLTIVDTLAQDATPPVLLTAGPRLPVAMGVMVEVVEDRTLLDDLVAKIGREPAIVMFHTHWGNDSGQFDPSLFVFLEERGVTPMVTWEAWRPFYAAGVAVAEQPEYALRTILSGDHDAYIDSWAVGIAELTAPVLLRFGHEMNGNWYPWAMGVNANTPEEFVAAWRYVHQRFVVAGASNVRWVWSPVAAEFAPMAPLFPGDDVVDYVAASGFNWGTTEQAWGVGVWQTFEEVFKPVYQTLSRLSDRPILIAEVSSAEEGGSKAGWITDAYLTQLTSRFPLVRGIVWFDIIKETDWRIDSSPESLRAFIAAVNNPLLAGSIT